MPVRLAALTFLPLGPNGFLGFTFRCLMRGGEIVTSTESPMVGFFSPTPLPRRMSNFHRERLEKAIAHAEERPLFFTHQVSAITRVARFMLRHVIYRWLDMKRRLRGETPFQPPPTWEIDVRLLCANAAGKLLWQRRPDGTWQLPGGIASGLHAPWETAVTLAAGQIGQQPQLGHLNSVYVQSGKSCLTLVFTANCSAGSANAQRLGWYVPGHEPSNCASNHRQIAAEYSPESAITLFDAFR